MNTPASPLWSGSPAIALLQAWGATRIQANVSVGGVLTDAVAQYADAPIILVAASRETLNQSCTKEHWRTLYAAARRANGCFVIVAQPADEDDAKALLHEIVGRALDAIVWPV